MKLFLDTAEFDEIKQGVDWGVVVGVTTNPTLIAKAGQDHETQVKRICGIVGNVSAEVVSDKKDDILVEGRRLAAWHTNVIVKVPLTPRRSRRGEDPRRGRHPHQRDALLQREPGAARRRDRGVHHQSLRRADRRHQRGRESRSSATSSPRTGSRTSRPRSSRPACADHCT